jgi:hypothetical protein
MRADMGEEKYMKNILKNEKFMKGIGLLLFVSVLLGSTVPTIANTAQESKSNSLKNRTIAESSAISVQGYEILAEANFTDGNMPPIDWELNQTNPDETWEIDATIPHSDPYCGTVHRGDSDELQDEWLITPTLDFSGENEIYLRFWWYTEYYIAYTADYIDLNISISTDGGDTWTVLWSEDDLSVVFPTWEWIDTVMGDPIDLSDYAGESNVKIGFQYYSNTAELSEYQELSLDDIIVYVPGEPFECQHGGPYIWWWPMQYEYDPPGVRFHGSVTGANWWECDWLWDFGEGNTSTLPRFPVQFYLVPFVRYNVTLQVKDNTTYPPRIAFNQTYVWLFLIEPPELDLTMKRSLLGIRAEIDNPGEYNATYVNCTITVDWGLPRKLFTQIALNETIDNIEAETTEIIRSNLWFPGFGRILITISVMPENIPGIIKNYDAIKLGPFVYCSEAE